MLGIRQCAAAGAANERYCEFLGRSREELCRLNFRDITHPDDLDAETVELDPMLIVGRIERYTARRPSSCRA